MARYLKWFPVMVAVFLVALFLVLWLSMSLQEANAYNQKLQQQELQGDSAPDAVFADANYWVKHNDMQRAQTLYTQLMLVDNEELRKYVFYNSANAYLRAASKLLDEQGLVVWDQVNPLLGMAKENYREALRLDPFWREAKYNYQLALRLSPIFEERYPQNSEDEEEQENAEYIEGWPSIPGFPRGMP